MKKVRSSSSRRRLKWRRFWRFHFLGRVLGLALSSGAGGFFTGALIGFSNWRTDGPFHPWWYWVGFTAPVCGVWMMVLGLALGVPLFGVTTLFSWRWSRVHKQRFARQMTRRVFLPLTVVLIIASAGALLFRIAQGNAFTSLAPDVGDTVLKAAMITLGLASCLLLIWLAFSSKTKPLRRAAPLQEERLLPLD